MDWNAISAIGTVVAAFVGIAGIWINVWDKNKRLHAHFEMIPLPQIILCNNSTKTVKIMKMSFSVNNHIFDVKVFEGLHEIVLPPSGMQTIIIDNQNIVESYYKHGIDAICNKTDKICVYLFDNYGRKYRIRLGYPIGVFEKM